VLVRHGEANAAVEQVVGGHAGCTGLSERGRRQVQALARRLERTEELAGASVLASSVLPRAIETAEAIAGALGGLPIDSQCDLCELHPGEADGLSWEEADRRFGPTRPFDPHRRVAPGGETWTEMAARTSSGLYRLATDNPGATVVVACHGGVVDSSFHAFLDVPARIFFPENASITEWAVDDEGSWQLRRFNDHAHLLELD